MKDRTRPQVEEVRCSSDIHKVVPAVEAVERGQVGAAVVVGTAAVGAEERRMVEAQRAGHIEGEPDILAEHGLQESAEELERKREREVAVVMLGSTFVVPRQRRWQ
jgi:hypothetical protein